MAFPARGAWLDYAVLRMDFLLSRQSLVHVDSYWLLSKEKCHDCTNGPILPGQSGLQVLQLSRGTLAACIRAPQAGDFPVGASLISPGPMSDVYGVSAIGAYLQFLGGNQDNSKRLH